VTCDSFGLGYFDLDEGISWFCIRRIGSQSVWPCDSLVAGKSSTALCSLTKSALCQNLGFALYYFEGFLLLFFKVIAIKTIKYKVWGYFI